MILTLANGELRQSQNHASSVPPGPSDDDIRQFKAGTHTRLHEFMGAHPLAASGAAGVRFSVWAPNASRVSVIGDFNAWDADADVLAPRWDESGIWEGTVRSVVEGARYKYRIVSAHTGQAVDKADPFAFFCEVPPRTASIVWSESYTWNDQAWMKSRGAANALDAPMSIYEVHPGSWRATRGAGGALSYRDLADAIADYVHDAGFTHVELMPITEHPFFGSWGYQTTGYFAPTARYGSPQDFMYFVDHLHRRGIGVILDWSPAHFPNDAHGLARFDGTHLYEHDDPRKGFHPEWQSHIFNYGRHEVRSFLTSSALFWLDRYHVDALRVDGVASMLYLDYARKPGEWLPNEHGGHENLEAVEFLRNLNASVYRDFPDTQTIAEESTAWPGVSRPVYAGGLGFGLKWNMGWMHDTLGYFQRDPVHRKFHQNDLTFSLVYAFNENFVLPLSHDEVVYGKHSLIGKMPGDAWQQFANLRCVYGYMWAHPGKKLLFMGGEIAQREEWAHESFIDWDALNHPANAGIHDWIRDLNHYYRRTPALFERDFDPAGFEWIDYGDSANSVLSFIRNPLPGGANATVLAVCNLTPVPRFDYAIGVPLEGHWREALNSDAACYGGSGMGNLGGVTARPVTAHGRPFSLPLTLPPLSVLFLESAR